MLKISAIIITRNEEKFIGRCLESLRGIADEVVVVDSFSTDSTGNICHEHGCRVETHAFEGYIEQKNYALSLATNKWVISLDADEALSDELKGSIKTVMKNPRHDGYYFNRRNNYCGRWLKFSGWYPDRHLRLFDSSKGQWTGLNPHDKFRLQAGCKAGLLKGDLLHWFYESVEEQKEKMEKFSTIAAESCYNAGIRSGVLTPLIHGTWSFARSYILRGGFLDGRYGFNICITGARGSCLKYKKLMALQKSKELKP